MSFERTRSSKTRGRAMAAIALVIVAFWSTAAVAGEPVEVPVQGLLTDSEGAPVDGATDVTFRIYGDASASDAVWTSETSVDVDDGLFDVALGEDEELDSDIFQAHAEAHMTIAVDGQEESAPIRLGTVPRAAHAISADTAEEAHSVQGMTPEDLTEEVAAEDVEFDDEEANLGASDTQKAIEALAARVADLEQERSDVQDDLDDTQNTVSSLESDVDDHSDQMSTLQSEVSDNTGDISSLQSEVGDNSSDIATLQTDVSANTGDISSLQTDVGDNASDISTLQSDVTANTSDITSLEDKTESMSATTINGEDAVTFDDVNVYVRNGSGSTSGSTNGTGNLYVGYGETSSSTTTSGSHNLILGEDNGFSSYGGIVGGSNNEITASGASVIGGSNNEASGDESVVVAGTYNEAADSMAAILAGYGGEANGFRAAIVGGWNNVAEGSYSSVLGGYDNTTDAYYNTVGGGNGVTNTTTDEFKAEGTLN